MMLWSEAGGWFLNSFLRIYQLTDESSVFSCFNFPTISWKFPVEISWSTSVPSWVIAVFSGHRPTEGCCALCDWLLNTQFFEAIKGRWPVSCCRPLDQFVGFLEIKSKLRFSEKKTGWGLESCGDEFCFHWIWFDMIYIPYGFLLLKTCSIFRLPCSTKHWRAKAAN